jgi:hypothetical protein
MKHFLPFTLVCVSMLFLTGCFDTKENFTLNPDGSGKVVVESVFAPFSMDMSNDKQTPEQKLNSSMRSVFENIKGVEAWKDVTFVQQDDGKVKFKGTAYFKDLSKVDLQGFALMNFSLLKTNGQLVLTAQMNQKDNAKEKPAAPAKLSDAEMAAKIKEAKGSYQSSRPMVVGILAPMQQDAVFHLPGTASEVSNFKTTPSGDLEITFAGTNMLAAMDDLMTNDDWLRTQVASGKDFQQDGMDMDNGLNEKLFGQNAPVRAMVSGGAAKFDYATEVAAATVEYAALKKKLGVGSGGNGMSVNMDDDNTADVAPPAQGGEFKSLKVGGIRWVFDSDDKNDVRPFNYSAGYALSIVGELPGSVMEISGGTLDTALASDGSDLLPEHDWDKKINNHSLSKDKSTVIFEVDMRAPGPEVKGFKEISGNLDYSVGDGITNMDLGITEIKDGATGSALDASIKSVKPGFGNNGGQDIEIKLNLEPHEIISVTAVGADGQEAVLKQNGYGGFNSSYTFTYHAKTELPAGARLFVKTYGQVKKYTIPFKLTNLTLLGQPVP